MTLGLMADDPEVEVRRIVASRMDADSAVMLLEDEDWVVRYEAAQRVPVSALQKVLQDEEPDVVEVAKMRLAEEQAG